SDVGLLLPGTIENFYVLKTDDEISSGHSKLWERAFVGQANANCGFGADITSDGGLIVAGNNGTKTAQGDDDENCEVFKISKDFEVNQTYTSGYSNGHTVSTSQTWTSADNKIIKGWLTIPDGVTLTLDGCTLQ